MYYVGILLSLCTTQLLVAAPEKLRTLDEAVTAIIRRLDGPKAHYFWHGQTNSCTEVPRFTGDDFSMNDQQKTLERARLEELITNAKQKEHFLTLSATLVAREQRVEWHYLDVAELLRDKHQSIDFLCIGSVRQAITNALKEYYKEHDLEILLDQVITELVYWSKDGSIMLDNDTTYSLGHPKSTSDLACSLAIELSNNYEPASMLVNYYGSSNGAFWKETLWKETLQTKDANTIKGESEDS